jgi:hypothetical protein
MQPPLFKTGCEHRRNGHHWVQDTENKTTTHSSEMLVRYRGKSGVRVGYYIYIYIVRRSIKTLMTTRRRCANRHRKTYIYNNNK